MIGATTAAGKGEQLFDKHVDTMGYKITSDFLNFLHK